MFPTDRGRWAFQLETPKRFRLERFSGKSARDRVADGEAETDGKAGGNVGEQLQYKRAVALAQAGLLRSQDTCQIVQYRFHARTP